MVTTDTLTSEEVGMSGAPLMTKMQPDDGQDGRMHRARPAALSASVRRHLGLNLRSLYAGSLVEPVSERIESLLTKLGREKS